MLLGENKETEELFEGRAETQQMPDFSAVLPMLEEILEMRDSKFYSHKTLLPETRLLITDYSGTIMQTDGERTGLKTLLKYCKRKDISIVVSTDVPKKFVLSQSETRVLAHYVDDVYGLHRSQHLITPPKNSRLHGYRIKNLGLILSDFKMKPEQAFMVGDTPMERLCAMAAGIPYYVVPATSKFDFAELIPRTGHKTH